MSTELLLLSKRSNIQKIVKTLVVGAAVTIVISSVNESLVMPVVNRIIPYIEKHHKDSTEINECDITRSILTALVNITLFVVAYQFIHLVVHNKLDTNFIFD